jgi:transcriptional accessory protein Tex/SPT6
MAAFPEENLAVLGLSTKTGGNIAQRADCDVEPNKGVIDSAAALEGARAILVERFREDAMLIGTLREEVWSRGRLTRDCEAIFRFDPNGHYAFTPDFVLPDAVSGHPPSKARQPEFM